MLGKLYYIGVRKELNIGTCTECIYICGSSLTSVITNPFLHKKEERTPSNVRLILLPFLVFALCTYHLLHSL